MSSRKAGADLVAESLPALRGHALGEGDGREAPRLGAHDRGAGLVKQQHREHGALPTARLSLHADDLGALQRGFDLRDVGPDRQFLELRGHGLQVLGLAGGVQGHGLRLVAGREERRRLDRTSHQAPDLPIFRVIGRHDSDTGMC